MKYISYTFIDDATQIPVSIEPARKGPIMPEGVEYVFSAEYSFSTGVPLFFGKVEDDFDIKDWMGEYSEENFLQTFKSELIKRASSKRKSLLAQGRIEESGVCFDYSKSTLDGLYSIVNAMVLDEDLSEVDFSTDTQWIKLSLIQAKSILVSLNKNIQSLFSWNFIIQDNIQKSSNIEGLISLQETISKYLGNSNDS